MTWLSPFSEFPREMGFPHRNGIVYNVSQFIDKVNRYNGRTTVFTSLYPFDYINSNGKPDYDSARIQHIYFDLDNTKSLEITRKMHEYLLEKDLRHSIFFSGGGFHVYIAVQYPNFLK